MQSHNSLFFFGINSIGLLNFEKNSLINYLFKFLSIYSFAAYSSTSNILYISPVFSCIPFLSFILWSQSWCFGSWVLFCSWLPMVHSISFLLRCTSSVVPFICGFSFFSHFLSRMIWYSSSSILSTLSHYFLPLTWVCIGVISHVTIPLLYEVFFPLIP